MSGYLGTGRSTFCCFAHLAHTFGGLSYLAGFPNETPVSGIAPLGDDISSLYGVIGIMLALRHKEKTGEGQVIDVGIYEAVFRQMDEMAAVYGLYGTVREREGAAASSPCHMGTSAPRTATTSRLPAPMTRCSSASPRRWSARSSPRARSMANSANGSPRPPAVIAIVNEWAAGLSCEELLERCIAKQVPVGKLNSIADIFADPHFQARGDLLEMEEEGLGKVVIPGVIPTLSETPGRVTIWARAWARRPTR